MSAAAVLALSALAAWLYLLLGRGGFWMARERDTRESAWAPKSWPGVVAVVPARNEADVIERSLGSLLRQDYPGRLRIVLVDDGSDDGTAVAAVRAAQAADGAARLEILRGSDLPKGWTGKLWALEQGIREAGRSAEPPVYLLLTDADIGHDPDNVRQLVARAERHGHVLTSLMVELSCRSWAERFLIPAFVFFFQMLYPFAWVARQAKGTAAAAGGCMLVKRDALEGSGGVAAIRSEIIDDCALAARLKKQGPIWLGLTRRARSLRPYGGLADIGRMVSRSAFAQLHYSPLLLAGTVLGMAVIYLLPPVVAVEGDGAARWAGLASWLAMALAFQPMLHFYRRSPLWGLALPAIALAYMLFTLRSAFEYWSGRGGMWKGRAQAMKHMTDGA